MKKLYIILAIFAAAFSATAQNTGRSEEISYSASAERNGTYVNIIVNVSLDDMRLKRQEMIVLTPILVSKSQNEVYHLAPAVVAGPKRLRSLNRLMDYGNMVFEQMPQIIMKRKNHLSQEVSLSYKLPYYDWMHEADLFLISDASGCVDCAHQIEQYLAIANVLPPLPAVYMPDFHVSFVVPAVEPVKQRSETFVARMNFVVNKYDILENYKDNARVLKEVDDLIRELQNDPDLTITRRTVRGYASPEGNFNSNLILSRNRARSFLNYLQVKYKWNPSSITSEGLGEDWEGLRKAVLETPGIAHREEVISIIDNTPDVVQRKRKLEALQGGSVYTMLLRDLYPPLRRNEFEVSYIARAFDVEEAKEKIRTRPQMLSLNEMFLVANTYEKGSAEFNEVFDIAARIFPDNPVSLTNTAATEIDSGLAKRAIARLGGIETPEAWNNLGIAYAKNGNYERAEEFLSKAAQAGDINARHNLQQLQMKMENNKILNP